MPSCPSIPSRTSCQGPKSGSPPDFPRTRIPVLVSSTSISACSPSSPSCPGSPSMPSCPSIPSRTSCQGPKSGSPPDLPRTRIPVLVSSTSISACSPSSPGVPIPPAPSSPGRACVNRMTYASSILSSGSSLSISMRSFPAS